MSINIWTDSMQHAALLGKPVLFTNWLIQRDIIPDGWYCYDLRGTHKSPSTRTTLVDHAADYHAGTVLSPIPLKHEGTASRRVNGTFYLLGEEMTLEQFCEEHDLAYPQDNREFVLRPASLDEVGLFYSEEKLDEALGTVGHLRMDFGHGEKEFWHTWWPHNEDRFNTPEFKEVLQRFVDDLRQTGLLKNLGAMDAYRRSFWTHRPLTDFWRVGKGYAAKLEAHGLYTMGDIARCSIGQPTDYHNEELLYKLFGVNAELLIDHAWGWEPCTIADIKAYKPENKSIVSGQILQYPYPFEKARLVIQEMADALALELVDKRLATNQLVLTVGYDIENLKGTAYTGEITTDHYGRKIPKHAHGTVNLDGYTSSGEELLKAATSLYDRIVDKTLLARRLTLCANHLLDESSVPEDLPEQIDLFTDYSAKEKQKKEADTAHARERKLQKTMLGIKKRFGKNAILKGLNLEDGATARERNNQIGGHKA